MDLMVRTCSTDRVNVSRLSARILIVLGGLVWAMMFFAQASTQRYANLTYSFREVTAAGVQAIIPLALTVAVFVLCLFYERLAALVLLLAAAAVAVYGVFAAWGPVLWVSAMSVLALPMVVSAALLLLAASTQRVCELEGKM
jgi:hypothetical protein